MRTRQLVIEAWEQRLGGANQHLLSVVVPKKLADATLRELTLLVAQVEQQKAEIERLRAGQETEHIGLAVSVPVES